MLLAAGALGGLTLLGLMNPWLLLALTFALGVGSAFNAPAWQAVIPEIVSKRRMPAVVALESAGFNLARAVGPAAGGLIVAWVDPGANFMLNAASFLATIWRLSRNRTGSYAKDSGQAVGVMLSQRPGQRPAQLGRWGRVVVQLSVCQRLGK
jgi:MFS family permease